MRRFLQFFPQFRTLARSLEDASTRALLAEQTVRTRDEECRWLREQLEAAHKETLIATRAMANFGIQRSFGFVLYPDAPSIPMGQRVEQPAGTLPNPRKATFDARAEAIEKFKSDGLQMWEEAQRQR